MTIRTETRKRKNKVNPIERFGDKIHHWKPGESGNPNGRPPIQKTIADILRRIGDEPAPRKFVKSLYETNPHGNFDNLNNRDAILYKTTYDAEDGNACARDFVVERTEGKVAALVKMNFNPEEINFLLNGVHPDEPTAGSDGSNGDNDQHTA